MKYYLFDQNGRIIFEGRSLTLALKISQAAERFGVKTTLHIEPQREKRHEHR